MGQLDFSIERYMWYHGRPWQRALSGFGIRVLRRLKDFTHTLSEVVSIWNGFRISALNNLMRQIGSQSDFIFFTIIMKISYGKNIFIYNEEVEVGMELSTWHTSLGKMKQKSSDWRVSLSHTLTSCFRQNQKQNKAV